MPRFASLPVGLWRRVCYKEVCLEGSNFGKLPRSCLGSIYERHRLVLGLSDLSATRHQLEFSSSGRTETNFDGIELPSPSFNLDAAVDPL